MKHALISVFDKTGVAEFAMELEKLGFSIISTGGTFTYLKEAGLQKLITVSEFTGHPEILGGLVKSLHPRIHGAILADRDNHAHLAELIENGIGNIDIVVNNLYPFEQAESIDNIDIGGPSMLRAAAKNHKHVAVITEPGDYNIVLGELRSSGSVSYNTKLRLAATAFAATARFDSNVHGYLHRLTGANDYPDTINFSYKKVTDFSYGENPHQRGVFYADKSRFDGIAAYRQLQGETISFNNINDANGAVKLVNEFNTPAAVAVKHTNPCGVGLGVTLAEAFTKAADADPESIFGGVIAFNMEVDASTVNAMKAVTILDVIIAPSFTDEALRLLSTRKRAKVLALPNYTPGNPYEIKRVTGGLLLQQANTVLFPDNKDITELPVVTTRKPTQSEYNDLLMAWRIVKHVNSNAITIAKAGQSMGIGIGQTKRIASLRYAIENSAVLGSDACRGAALASDGFFPFNDSVEAAAAAGITAIIQPGGSVRDEDFVKACNKHGISMILTGMRHFKH